MSEPTYDFGLLMHHVRAGSPIAGAALVEEFGHHVKRVVRKHLRHDLRSIFDSDDFVQETWRDFFAQGMKDAHFANADELSAFLATIAKRKVIMSQRQWLTSQRRSLHKQQSLADLEDPEASSPPDPAPLPEETASQKEEVNRVLDQLANRNRLIVLLLWEGYTHAEVSKELGVTEKTVQRVLFRIRERFGLPQP